MGGCVYVQSVGRGGVNEYVYVLACDVVQTTSRHLYYKFNKAT